MPTAVRSVSVPKTTQGLFEKVTGLTDAFCQKWLNEEYAQLCRELTATLCRKRPTPLERGGPEGWAAGIVSALGSVNFLHDKTQTPHMRISDIGPHFGVTPSTAAAKAKQIRETLRMTQFDPRWSLPSNLDKNPLAWFIQIDGFVIDVRQAPRPIQEAAFKLGLIPRMPA